MVRARKQVSAPIGPQKSDKKSQQNYNIWYNKVTGERHKPGQERTRAITRCDIEKDAGDTKGTNNDISGICLNFARGCCPLGYDCSWRHVLPTADMYNANSMMRDCFCRERHKDVRDDQSGVGSFTADDETSRTLYVGGISKTPNMHSVVYKHFKEWGDIDNVRILDVKGVAFIRYKNRSNAEFAMEAMQRQSLDGNEILNIRWATNDPNPWVSKRKEKNAKRKLVEAAINSGIRDEAIVSSIKKVCHGADGVTGYYPNTDYLYQETAKPTPAIPSHTQSTPRTLSDLVTWSHKQASIEKDKQDKTITALVDYNGSSSDEE